MQSSLSVSGNHFSSAGTILEAAFIDPAYTWPPPDGQGKNAIELQASIQLLEDDNSILTTESEKERMKIPPKPIAVVKSQLKWWNCCKSTDAAMVDLKDYEEAKQKALQARKDHYNKKKQKAKEVRKQSRFSRVPEGILIYRLDTSNQTLTLMSDPHPETNLAKLVTELVIAKSRPSPDKSRKGIWLQGVDGQEYTLIACEQRTAINWLETMDLMLANKQRLGKNIKHMESREWKKNGLSGPELDAIEGQYLNLANYSNKLIRADKKNKRQQKEYQQSGIFYSIEVSKDPADEFEEEALESIAKRRAVIKDSWDFYRMICSLLRDRRKYAEVFRKMQMDPVYPYLHSMTGLNDPGDTGYENADKVIIQKDLDRYANMTRIQVAEHLCRKAEAALPSLVEICKALAGSLGMEEVGIGPVKEVSAAMKKAEKKYEGDLLKVTDYCRALLVVKDFPSLLALLELARDSFGPLIRRVKLSSLKNDHKPKPGGYRDCIINLELKDHICEIQIHLWPMWVVCGVDGFRHYRHCLEYNTDSFDNAFDALEGLDRKTMAELLVMAEEAVAETPLESLEWFQEKFILDYFAEVGLFMKHGLHVWAEITLRHLILLRTQSPDIGPDHHETILLYRYLAEVLRKLGNNKEAKEIDERIGDHEHKVRTETSDAEKSMWDTFMSAGTEAYDMVFDPNKQERDEENRLRKEVKASKRHWRMIRKERFSFLDDGAEAEEKKVDYE